jgi:hypothetical protein
MCLAEPRVTAGSRRQFIHNGFALGKPSNCVGREVRLSAIAGARQSQDSAVLDTLLSLLGSFRPIISSRLGLLPSARLCTIVKNRQSDCEKLHPTVALENELNPGD